MSASRRVLVHLQPAAGPPVLAAFTDCLLASINLGKQQSGLVTVQLSDNRLILAPASLNTEHGSQDKSRSPPVQLTHPPFCPASCLSPSAALSLPEATRARGVDVGVVILLETADTRLLLTRRASHMRTFPGTWVPPGQSLSK